VHGADGLDELSTTGYTKVSECRDGAVQTFYVHPSEYGLPKASLDALRGGDAATNAAIVRQVLEGGAEAARDVVLLNAGAALFIAGRVSSVRDGIAAAAAAIDTGRAKNVLQNLTTLSRTPARGTA
jgi:anthranilate phosphoribosyltransferase